MPRPAAVARLRSMATAYLSTFSGAAAERTASGFEIVLSSSTLEITGPDDFAARFGTAAPTTAGELRLAAIAFSAGDTASLESRLVDNDIPHLRRDRRIVVPPAAGQGATFIFEEQP